MLFHQQNSFEGTKLYLRRARLYLKGEKFHLKREKLHLREGKVSFFGVKLRLRGETSFEMDKATFETGQSFI